MDFRSFKNSFDGGKSQEDNVRKTINDYKDKSQEELLSEIVKMAKSGKADGTFDATTLENFANTMMPLLGENERQRLKNVIEMLKKS